MRKLVLWVGVWAVTVGCGWGQGAPAEGEARTMVSMAPTPLLPETIGEWKESNASRGDVTGAKFVEATCAPVGDNAAQGAGASSPEHCTSYLKEDGFSRYAVASYQRGGASAEVFALEFGDATGAYSAYTFYRTMMHGARIVGAEARLGKLANETWADADSTLIWAGTAVVKVTGRLNEADFRTLVSGLPKVGGRKGLAPLLPTMIPAEAGGVKVEAASVRYALGPVGYQAMGGVLPPDGLGWDKSLEVATADYAGRGGRGTLTLLLYPTPQIAGDRGRAVQNAINGRRAAGPETAKLGTVMMRRVGPLVGVTSGGLTAEEAKALVGALRLDEIVTFDKPMPLEFHAEVRKTATLLQEIAVFTGVLILAAVVIAVFLGGLRAGIRVLRGKPAASEPEFLTINLRGEPKAILTGKQANSESSMRK